MSVGCFIGIRSSYIDEAQGAAEGYLAAINKALHAKGLPDYTDPADAPEVYSKGLFGRSALDHHNAGCLADFARKASAHSPAPHLALVATNPYRVAFVPLDLEVPLVTDYLERISGEHVRIWVGSAPRLVAELVSVAPLLGITLDSGQLPDSIAQKINDFAPLFEGDDCSLAEDERTAWLVLYEGARLAVQHGVALSLAG